MAKKKTTTETTYKCEHCEFEAKSQRGLTQHMNTKHKGSQALATAAPERKLAWGGAMPKAGGSDAQVQVFCNQVAQIYGVPSLGVNAMGNNPYLNKDGRLFLLHDLRKGAESGIKAIRTNYLQLSTAPDMMSVAKVTIEFFDGHEVEGIGEASKENIKLAAVQKTLNMMAETRALNRAIWKEIAGDVWNRVSENLKTANMTDEEKARVKDAGRVSYEEMESSQEPEVNMQEAERQLRVFIKQCKDVGTLIEYDEKLKDSPMYSDSFKAEMHGIITQKVNELGG